MPPLPEGTCCALRDHPNRSKTCPRSSTRYALLPFFSNVENAPERAPFFFPNRSDAHAAEGALPMQTRTPRTPEENAAVLAERAAKGVHVCAAPFEIVDSVAAECRQAETRSFVEAQRFPESAGEEKEAGVSAEVSSVEDARRE